MAKTAVKTTSFKLNSQGGNILIGVIAVAAAYGTGSRAIDTGSLQQYGLAFLLLALGITRFISAFRHK